MDSTDIGGLNPWLDTLGAMPHMHLSVGWQRPGDQFRGRTMKVSDLRTADVPQDSNLWIGLGVMRPEATGRGKADDVVRLLGVWTDLDAKTGGCGDMATCGAVTADLAAILGVDPTYTVMSGHGLQPVWVINPDGTAVEAQKALLARFGLLAQKVAEKHGGAVDKVFDPARVLRAPYSVNWKDADHPVPVEYRNGTKERLTWKQLADVLDGHGVAEAAPSGGSVELNTDWFTPGDPCPAVERALGRAVASLKRGRHPAMVAGQTSLARLGEQGHEGTAQALESLRGAFLAAVGTDRDAEAEWEQALGTLALQEATPAEDKGCCVRPRRTPIDVAALLALGEEEEEEEPTEKSGPRFAPVDYRALFADPPTREWLVEGIVPKGAAVSLVAPAGAGKSMLSLHMALCLARGVPFLGYPVKKARVLYVDRENTLVDLAERLDQLGITEDDADWLQESVLYLSLPDLAPLDTKDGAVDLATACRENGIGKDDLVVLDSAQRMVEGDEDKADTWRAFYRHTASALKKAGITTLRLDNVGKDESKGARGSSSKRDDVDVEWQYRRNAKVPGMFTLRSTKNRSNAEEEVEARFEYGDGFNSVPLGLVQYESLTAYRDHAMDKAVKFLSDNLIDPSMGVNKAWEAVRGIAGCPTRRMVEKAQMKRRGPS